MFVAISILVPNQFVVCGDTFILISDTMQHDNVHIKQNNNKNQLFGCIEKSNNTKAAS